MLIIDQSCKAPWVQLTAPGVDIKTADYRTKVPREGSGTSLGKPRSQRNQRISLKNYLASPQIAGLGTVIAAEGDYGSVQESWGAGVRQLRQELMFLAYSRSQVTPVNLLNYPLGIWNGVRQVNGQCGTWVPPTQKRDATPDECSINMNPTSSSAIATQTSIAPSPSTVPGGQTSTIATQTSIIPSPSTVPSEEQIFTNVTVAPSSVILGFNQTAILTAIVSQLNSMCDPTNVTCTEYGEIDNVYSYFANVVTKGTLKITIPESKFTSRAQRDGLILRAAQAMSGSGSNCATREEETGNCFGRREVGGSLPCDVTYVDVCHYTDSVDVVVFRDEIGLVAQMVRHVFFSLLYTLPLC